MREIDCQSIDWVGPCLILFPELDKLSGFRDEDQIVIAKETNEKGSCGWINAMQFVFDRGEGKFPKLNYLINDPCAIQGHRKLAQRVLENLSSRRFDPTLDNGLFALWTIFPLDLM